jgi:hypothetical protein
VTNWFRVIDYASGLIGCTTVELTPGLLTGGPEK